MYGMKGPVPEEEYLIPIGLADVKREGTDVTIVTFGKMVHTCLDTAAELAKEGISAEVIDMRSLRPIDYDTIIESVKKTNRCVVVEECWPLAAFSGELTYLIHKRSFDYLDAPVVRVTGRDTSMAYSQPLVDAFLPSVKRIIDAVNAVMYR